MSTVRLLYHLDTLAITCYQAILKKAVGAWEFKRGEVVEIVGDCPAFEEQPNEGICHGY